MRVERRGDIAIVRMAAGKANALNPGFLDELVRLFDEAEASGATAVVLTGAGRSFSAGLALPALIDLSRDDMRSFMQRFEAAMLRLFRCPRPVVAAVNGHAIAGGCVLVLQCDTRIAADGDYRIGLNEVQLGIGLPAVVVETLRVAVPTRSLVPIALDGELCNPRRALALGLVDDVVPAGELEERALARAAELARGTGPGYAQVKAALHQPALDAIVARSAVDLEAWLDTWFSETARARIAATVHRLTARPTSP